VVRDLGGDLGRVGERINAVIGELYGQVPAFYGVQRFGTTRPITHLVGREIVKGDFYGALMVYLAKDYPGEKAEIREARKRLMETGDFREALKSFPERLGYENAMLNYLVQRPEDYVGGVSRVAEEPFHDVCTCISGVYIQQGFERVYTQGDSCRKASASRFCDGS